jgi:hypothetical protein
MALIRQPGQVVTRDEFQQQLWKGGTFVDFDHGLNAAMNRLRQALGDSADQPRYIETLAGRGYRFVASVQATVQKPVLVMASAPVAEEVESADPAPPVILQKERKAGPPWVVTAGLIACLVGGYLVANRSQPKSVGQTLRYSISPPNGYALEAGSSRQTFALSPDGARLAFTAMDSSGAFQTFIRDLDGLESRPLANSNYSYTVFWAPDGHSLFQTVRGSLRRTVLEGDSYQVLCDTPPIMLMAALLPPNLLISGRSAKLRGPHFRGYATGY